MHHESEVDIENTLTAAVLTLAGSGARLVPGPNDELLLSLQDFARATALTELAARRYLLRFPVVLRTPVRENEEQHAWVATDFLPTVLYCLRPSALRSREAQQRVPGLQAIARGLVTGSRALSREAIEFLTSIGLKPVPFWLDRAIAEFNGLQLPRYGTWPDPNRVPCVRRARAVAAQADWVPFDSAAEIAITKAWINAIEEIRNVLRSGCSEAPPESLANAAVIEHARLLQWINLRGINERPQST